MTLKKVKEIMVKRVIEADYTDQIRDISKIMYENNIGSVIVKKNDIPVGIITDGLLHNYRIILLLF